MRYFESIDHAGLRGAYVSVGSFDGVHRGHRYLLEKMIQAAGEDGAPSAAVTFFPHPRIVLGPPDAARSFRYLTTLGERLSLLRGLPLDALILQPFDATFAQTSAARFLQILRENLGMRSFWCSPSFSFGHGREGDVAYLTEKSLILGFSLYVVPPLTDSSGAITSSRIRRALAEGEVAVAAGMLGRPFALSGTVVHGVGRGRRMSTPTANLDLPPEIMLPVSGVYATWAFPAAGRAASVTSIGVRPTFADTDRRGTTVETHILDFDGDLYGSTLRVEFAARLRSERRFAGMADLHEQMDKDILRARRLLQEGS
jgi:riboflavin kinase/FMN adenylyltransferase